MSKVILCDICGEIIPKDNKDYVFFRNTGLGTQREPEEERIDICKECYDKLLFKETKK